MNIGKFKIELSDEVKQEVDIIRKTAMITFSLCIIFVIIISGTFYVLVSFWGPLKPAKVQLSSSLRGITYIPLDFSLDDDLSDFVLTYCQNRSIQYDRAWCVQEIMKKNYKYVENDETLKSLGSMMETGGVCRDYANNYCRIMNRMEINCYLVPVTEHVFSVVEFSDYNESDYISSTRRCVVDQINMFCW